MKGANERGRRNCADCVTFDEINQILVYLLTDGTPLDRNTRDADLSIVSGFNFEFYVIKIMHKVKSKIKSIKFMLN